MNAGVHAAGMVPATTSGMHETRLPHEKNLHLPNAATMARLLMHRGSNAVSIYLPTVEAGDAITKNRIRFKNAMQQATDALRSMDADESTIRRTLEPVQAWLSDDDWWAHQGHGLAVFLHDGAHEVFRLPATVESRTLVGDRFHMLPLLQLRNASWPHYVLCLDQQGPTLYSATAYTLDEVMMTLPGLEDALGHQTTEAHSQGHSTTSDGGRWILHGHGGGSDEERKRELEKYCRVIDERVRAILPNARTPLVVVAVDYVGALYVSASEHPTIIGRVSGSPDAFDREELHRRSFSIVEAHFAEPRQRDLEALGRAMRQDEAAADIEQVLRAASDGRVEVLFLQPGERVTGEWEPTERSVTERPDDGARSDHALMDLAAREVLGRGGRLRFVADTALPVDEPVAAILRY